jgi:putative ABC transport system permease protein
MKALGATSGQIARIYLLQAALLGTAAILVALPVGILGGRRLTTVLAALLNFDMSSFGTPAWVYLLAAAAGWAVPLLAAAYPVWRGSRIPIRVALADSGASSETFGTSVLDSLLARFSGRLRPVLMALRNSLRRRVRLALTLATLVAGGVFFLTGLNIRASMMNTLDRYFSAQRFDLSVYLGEMYPRQAIQGAIAKIPGILRSEEWVGTEAAIGKDEVNLVGLPPEAKLLKLDIIRGRNLLPNDTNAAVLNSESAVPGQQITLRMGRAQASVSVVGISREQFMRQTAYVPLALLDQAGPAGYANNIRLELATKTDPALVERVRTDLDRNLGEAHIRAESFSHTADTRIGFDQHLLMIYVFLIFVSALIAAIGGLGLMTTMSLNILERRREMGVLRAIGATPAMVSLIVVTEGVAIGFLSWVLSGLAAWPLSKILGDMLWRSAFKTSLDFRLDPSALPIWFTVSIFLGVVASLVPAWNAARTTIREALSHE